MHNPNNIIENKPKTLVRNPQDVLLTWECVFNIDEDDNTFILQICNEFKEWKTVYCGKSTKVRVDNLAPCTCYNFRIKTDHIDWIYFKAATEDEGPFSSVMHMSRAVKLGKTPLIRKIAHIRPHLLEAENKENKTPLIQAVETGDLQVLQLLIFLGANVNTPLYHSKRTALMIAIYKNRLQVASLLIDKGADVNKKDINGLNVLHHAVDSNNVENVKFALKLGLDINSRDNNGWTPLLRAAILNISNEIRNLLLENGADKNFKDKNGFNYEIHMKIALLFSRM